MPLPCPQHTLLTKFYGLHQVTLKSGRKVRGGAAASGQLAAPFCHQQAPYLAPSSGWPGCVELSSCPCLASALCRHSAPTDRLAHGHTSAHVHACMHACMHTHSRACKHTHMHIHTHVRTHTCVYRYTLWSWAISWPAAPSCSCTKSLTSKAAGWAAQQVGAGSQCSAGASVQVPSKQGTRNVCCTSGLVSKVAPAISHLRVLPAPVTLQAQRASQSQTASSRTWTWTCTSGKCGCVPRNLAGQVLANHNFSLGLGPFSIYTHTHAHAHGAGWRRGG